MAQGRPPAHHRLAWFVQAADWPSMRRLLPELIVWAQSTGLDPSASVSARRTEVDLETLGLLAVVAWNGRENVSPVVGLPQFQDCIDELFRD